MSISCCFLVKLFFFLPTNQILLFKFTVKTYISFSQLMSLFEISPMQQIWKNLSHSIRPTYYFVIFFVLYYDKSRF